mgnify:CR=1 FL=1
MNKADIWLLGILYLIVLLFIDKGTLGHNYKFPITEENLPKNITSFSQELVLKMLK